MKEEIKQKLFELADEKYKQFHSNLCPGTDNILGVRIPILRNYAKKLIKQYKLDELLKNIDNEYYEEIMLQGMLIGLSKNDIDIILKYIKDFVPKIDNWAICDVFCAGLKLTKKYKNEMWKFVCNYLESDNEFEVRFSLVMILGYYIEEQYLSMDFKIFDNITHTGYYVQMANAWAISLCLIKYYDETLQYLKNCKLDKFTYNKALQKAIESFRITDKQKDELRKMKRN